MRSTRLRERPNPSEVIFDVTEIKKQISDLDKELQKEESWSSHEKIQKLQKKKARLEYTLLPYTEISEKLDYLKKSGDVS
jgi:protein subunit release factor A